MALKGKWKDKVNGVDLNSADDINQVAHAVIELEEKGSGGISQETDPTVPEWAKQPNKPKYTASEVGALPATTKIPAKTSDLTNDSDFITKAVSDLANYYLKSQTYTKDEVNALVSAIPKFSISVVSSLPTSNISETMIYLVGGGSGNDLYTEYIYTGGKWEILGSQKVDLTEYAKETWVNTQLSSYLKLSELDAAVEAALTEAKESGEFDGADGKDGTSITITNIDQTSESGGVNVVTFSDGTNLLVRNGYKGDKGNAGTDGDDGRGIKSITRTSGTGAAGTTDTYTITYTDGTKSTFTVYNGKNGTNGKDGTSVTVLKVTESSASGGTNVVTFSDGTTLNVKNGKDGTAGGGTDNKWAGKIASFLGDSITRGMNTDKTYHAYLKELVGFSACNAYGISGSTITNYYEAMCERVSTIDEQSDIIFVFGGTNDFNVGKAMGEWYTLSGTTRTINKDKSTFRGALNILCEALLNRFPNKKNVLLTPLHRHTYPDDLTELEANSQGLYLEDYVNAIKEAGKIYSIPVIDLYSESGLFPRSNASAAIYFHSNDKLHPNATGHRVIADVIRGFLDRTYPMFGEPVLPSYTNLVPSAEERIITNDALTSYDGVGYANNYRLSSSGAIKSAAMAIATGFIPVSAGDTIRIGGIQWALKGGSSNYVCAYKSDYSFIGAVYGSEAGTYGTKIHASCTIDYNTPLSTIVLANNADIAFIRLSCYNQTTQDGSKLIVTRNEEIS